jgi:hypothetical protein
MREGHPVRLDRVSLDLRDELAFVPGTGLEPAVALKHPLHRLLAASVVTRF